MCSCLHCLTTIMVDDILSDVPRTETFTDKLICQSLILIMLSLIADFLPHSQTQVQQVDRRNELLP